MAWICVKSQYAKYLQTTLNMLENTYIISEL